jgi:hypothetical protein
MAIKTNSPPPGVYKSQSDFDHKNSYQNTTSLGQGRDKVLFGSFLGACKISKNIPSPNKYDIKLPFSKIGGRMGERIVTEPDLKYQKSIPGPGEYQLTVT